MFSRESDPVSRKLIDKSISLDMNLGALGPPGGEGDIMEPVGTTRWVRRFLDQLGRVSSFDDQVNMHLFSCSNGVITQELPHGCNLKIRRHYNVNNNQRAMFLGLDECQIVG